MKTTTRKPKLVPPADSEMFRHGKAHLKRIAAGKGARAEAAQAELDRRAHNRSVKRSMS